MWQSWGVVGFHTSISKHFQAIIDNQNDFNLIAVCDVDDVKVTGVCKKYHVRGYNDLKSMLTQRSDVDLVSLCTPSCLLFLGVFFFMKKIKIRLDLFSQTRTDAWTAMTDQVLSGLAMIKEAKLYSCEHVFINNFYDHASKLKSVSEFQAVYSQAPRMLIEFIGLTVL